MKPPKPRKGLGDIVEKAIEIATFGQGEKIAKSLARKRGRKDCGCKRRKEALNRLGNPKDKQ